MDTLLALSIRQLTGGRRLLLLFLLAALPIGLALLLTLTQGEDETSNSGYVNFLDGLLISAVMPVIGLVLATAAFGNEVEDRTLNFLVLKPISRYKIVLAKLLATLVIGCPLIVISGVATTLIGDGGLGAKLVVLDSTPQAVAAVGIALFLGSLTYSSLFTWAGLVSTRALPYALVYVVLWEGLVSSFLGGVRYLSVRGYTLGLVHGLDERSFAELGDRVIEFPAALVGVAAVTAGFFLLAVKRLRDMDVP
jgi:ABC-2 type transport system permease protein